MTKWLPFDTPLDDDIAAFTADLVNIYEGDSLENIVNDPLLADKLEEEFRDDLLEDSEGDLPTWLDPDVDLEGALETIDTMVSVVKARLDMGFSEKLSSPLLPISIPLLVAAGIVGVVALR